MKNQTKSVKAVFKVSVPPEMMELIANVVELASATRQGEYLLVGVPHRFGGYDTGVIWAVVENVQVYPSSPVPVAEVRALIGKPFLFSCSEGYGQSSTIRVLARSLRHVMLVDGITVLKYFKMHPETEALLQADEPPDQLFADFDIDWDNIAPVEF